MAGAFPLPAIPFATYFTQYVKTTPARAEIQPLVPYDTPVDLRLLPFLPCHEVNYQQCQVKNQDPHQLVTPAPRFAL